jgi:hypothetical protein
MSASEAAYFDGNHCQHVAAYHDHLRQVRIEKQQIRRRAAREWALLDGRSIQRKVQDELAAQRADPIWRARVNAEWEAL